MLTNKRQRRLMPVNNVVGLVLRLDGTVARAGSITTFINMVSGSSWLATIDLVRLSMVSLGGRDLMAPHVPIDSSRLHVMWRHHLPSLIATRERLSGRAQHLHSLHSHRDYNHPLLNVPSIQSVQGYDVCMRAPWRNLQRIDCAVLSPSAGGVEPPCVCSSPADEAKCPAAIPILNADSPLGLNPFTLTSIVARCMNVCHYSLQRLKQLRSLTVTGTMRIGLSRKILMPALPDALEHLTNNAFSGCLQPPGTLHHGAVLPNNLRSLELQRWAGEIVPGCLPSTLRQLTLGEASPAKDVPWAAVLPPKLKAFKTDALLRWGEEGEAGTVAELLAAAPFLQTLDLTAMGEDLNLLQRGCLSLSTHAALKSLFIPNFLVEHGTAFPPTLEALELHGVCGEGPTGNGEPGNPPRLCAAIVADNLKKLDLAGSINREHVVLRSDGSRALLKELSINFLAQDHEPEASRQQLDQLLRNVAPSLESLTLQGCGLNMTGALRPLTHLTSLDLSKVVAPIATEELAPNLQQLLLSKHAYTFISTGMDFPLNLYALNAGCCAAPELATAVNAMTQLRCLCAMRLQSPVDLNNKPYLDEVTIGVEAVRYFDMAWRERVRQVSLVPVQDLDDFGLDGEEGEGEGASDSD